MNVLISSCLLGFPCRYSGDGYPVPELPGLLADPRLHFVPVCREHLGGLPTPRPPAERAGARVLDRTGADMTGPYLRGARHTLELARLLDCRCALLKARSPSCGSGVIYDGTFTGTRIPGDGVAAEILRENGISVFDEEHLDAFWTFLDREDTE